MLRDSLAQYEDKKQRKAQQQAARRLRREQLEAQSKKTEDDSMNSSHSLSHSSANRNNSVFEEINKGDDFEDMIDDINKGQGSSD
jgi:hypothetical protein